MIPAGYMAKQVCKKSEWLDAAQVVDIHSVSSHISDDFADYISFWKHNGYWLFDSPEIIRSIAHENSIDLQSTSLFYYEVFEQEFDGTKWDTYPLDGEVNVVVPHDKRLEGFDVVTFYAKSSPECSPLSCNGMAKEIPTNSHCLLSSFEDAYSRISNGEFNNSEPGPYRIFAVYSTGWDHAPSG